MYSAGGKNHENCFSCAIQPNEGTHESYKNLKDGAPQHVCGNHNFDPNSHRCSARIDQSDGGKKTKEGKKNHAGGKKPRPILSCLPTKYDRKCIQLLYMSLFKHASSFKVNKFRIDVVVFQDQANISTTG